MIGRRYARRVLCLGGAVLVFMGAALTSLPNQPARAADQTTAESDEPATSGGPPAFRRLNETQYVRSIEQIFGAGVRVPGRFEPPLRQDGLMAIGDGVVAVSPSGIEQYELRAREISSQVLAPEHRASVLTCPPPSPATFDRSCASEFFRKYGRLLFRRPLTDGELASVVGVASAAAGRSDFPTGMQAGLSRLLVSPNFIFRVESAEPNPAISGAGRLDEYSLASRISFLLWDAPPDDQLLDAAAKGGLRDDAELARQVDRMIASPRLEQGVRSFFSDMFGYEQFNGLAKDPAIFPKFNAQLAKDAQEQTLRTIVDLLVVRKGDYRDLFTTRSTFINRNLGALYKVPVDEAGMDGWAPHVFGPDEPRGGILALAAFLMLDPTHEGRSSPTIRGKMIRELLLCQPVPMPPPNVNFAAVQDVHNPLFRTARQRLQVHQSNPVCAGCHALTDPIGLSIENYDAIGNYRTSENDSLIDASGRFDGKAYKGLDGFAQLLHDSPDVPLCAVKRVYEYGVGRAMAAGEDRWLEHTTELFARDKYQFPALLRRVALSRAFRTVAQQKQPSPGVVTAAR